MTQPGYINFRDVALEAELSARSNGRPALLAKRLIHDHLALLEAELRRTQTRADGRLWVKRAVDRMARMSSLSPRTRCSPADLADEARIVGAPDFVCGWIRTLSPGQVAALVDFVEREG